LAQGAALEAEPAILFLDGIDGAGFRTYRFLQRLYYARGMAVCAAARDLRSLGALSRLFWVQSTSVAVCRSRRRK